MAYKYPKGTSNVDSIIADIVATTAWVDFVIGLKLAHIAFPINLNEPASENQSLFQKFFKYHEDIISKMTYRQKIDHFFALVEINGDDQMQKAYKTMAIKLGEIRNTVAHNLAVSLIPADFDLSKNNVGANIINEQYDLFNQIFARLDQFIEGLEESMARS